MMSSAPTEPGEPSMKRTAMSWLFQQEAQTVLLFLIVIAIGYGTYYAMDKAIPGHLDTIQKGYDRIQQQHEKSESRSIEVFEKSIDRISKENSTAREEFFDMVREMNGKPPREKTAKAEE